MNIKITKKQSSILFNNEIERYCIGSRLYGNYTDTSDTDILVIYKSIHSSDKIYPNYHQFQWDDEETNTQYLFTTENRFWINLLSGDSTINADVVLAYSNISFEEKLNRLKTYNIIKSFIGFAKRDIRCIEQNKGKNKIFHINRSLYCAEQLMNNNLPVISNFVNLNEINIDVLRENEKKLRQRCNEMFNNNELTRYPLKPIIEMGDELELLLVNANNIKEFKYE